MMAIDSPVSPGYRSTSSDDIEVKQAKLDYYEAVALSAKAKLELLEAKASSSENSCKSGGSAHDMTVDYDMFERPKPATPYWLLPTPVAFELAPTSAGICR